MKKAIGTAAKESWDVAKNLPYGLAVSPVKLLGMPRRIVNAIGATSRELVGIFADSAYAVQNVITGNAPERVGFVKRAGNIMKSYAKVPIGDPRKNIKADFAYEKDKTEALLKRGGEALWTVGQVPKKVRGKIVQTSKDLLSVLGGSGKPAAAA